MREPTRRQILRTTAVAGGIALAGCSSDSSTPESNDDGGTPESNDDGGGSSTSWEQTETVDMNDELKYVPKRIEVSAGTTVTWKTVGTIGHTITAYEDELPDGAMYFASGGSESEQAAVEAYQDDSTGNVLEGETYEHTFETTGTYKYYCIPHEMNGMIGFVKVV